MLIKFNKNDLFQISSLNRTLLFFILIGIFVACKSTNYTPLNFPNAKITFGSGGGFTGATTETIILENGQVFRKNALKEEITELEKLTQKEAKEIFNRYKALDLTEQKKAVLSDQYRFIKFKENGKEYTYAWGTDANKNTQTEIVEYFNYLRTTIKKINS
jgi:hypothetical protein